MMYWVKFGDNVFCSAYGLSSLLFLKGLSSIWVFLLDNFEFELLISKSLVNLLS